MTGPMSEAQLSLAVRRLLSTARATVPSTTISTFNSRAICGRASLDPLNRIAEVREITCRELTCARLVINTSVIASAKYSCLAKGVNKRTVQPAPACVAALGLN